MKWRSPSSLAPYFRGNLHQRAASDHTGSLISRRLSSLPTVRAHLSEQKPAQINYRKKMVSATTKYFLAMVDNGERSSTVVSSSHVKVHSHQRKESTCNLEDRNHSRSTFWLLRRTSCLQGANPEWAVPDQLCHVEIAKRPGKEFVACSKEGISTFSQSHYAVSVLPLSLTTMTY